MTRARILAVTTLLGAFAALPAAAAQYRHPSECGDGCLMVTAYFDHGGPSDWACGGNSYGGHRGTDFGIFGGFGAVDEGRAVVAAAPGTVVQANDGEFDRCTTGNCSGGGGFGNYVAIEHDDGVVTFYGHMRQGSVAVGVGDVVGCGQFLGFVASSGSSTGPHVHFEPRAGSSLDPFAGACAGGPSMWVDQGGYNALPSQQCEGPPNQAPRGHLDGASCDGVTGWAQDPDAPDAAIAVHVYIDGEAGSGARGFPIAAANPRDDLCAAIGSCAHGFTLPIPPSLRDGVTHTAFAYGIDTAGGNNPLLDGAGASFTCAPLPVPAGVLRHVPSPDVMNAWGFSFDDITQSSSLADHSSSDDWASAPRLILGEGDSAVYLVDSDGSRRHVTSPASMEAWHFSFAAVETVPAADVAAMPDGPALPDAPFLVAVVGEPAVYVVDAAPAASPPPEPSTPPDPQTPPDPSTPPGSSGSHDPSSGPTGHGPRVGGPASAAQGCASTTSSAPVGALFLVLGAAARTRRHALRGKKS